MFSESLIISNGSESQEMQPFFLGIVSNVYIFRLNAYLKKSKRLFVIILLEVSRVAFRAVSDLESSDIV